MRAGFARGRWRVAVLACATGAGAWLGSAVSAAAAQPQVRCHLPSGKIVQVTRPQCRAQIGLVLGEVSSPGSGAARSGDPTKSDAHLLGAGMGFFVSATGTIVTAKHVIRDCSSVVVFAKGNPLSWARVLARDPKADLAIVGSQLHPRAVARLRPADVGVGEELATIKLPYGDPDGRASIEAGKVISVTETAAGLPSFWYAGEAEHGMSGGPLLDSFGRVAGVFSALREKSRAGQGAQSDSYGYAIQVAPLRQFLADQHVAYAVGTAGPSLGEDALAQAALSMSVGVLCAD